MLLAPAFWVLKEGSDSGFWLSFDYLWKDDSWVSLSYYCQCYMYICKPLYTAFCWETLVDRPYTTLVKSHLVETLSINRYYMLVRHWRSLAGQYSNAVNVVLNLQSTSVKVHSSLCLRLSIDFTNFWKTIKMIMAVTSCWRPMWRTCSQPHSLYHRPPHQTSMEVCSFHGFVKQGERRRAMHAARFFAHKAAWVKASCAKQPG